MQLFKGTFIALDKQNRVLVPGKIRLGPRLWRILGFRVGVVAEVCGYIANQEEHHPEARFCRAYRNYS